MNSKSVLITGGNSGIGLATAMAFQNLGYDVTILGRNAIHTNEIAEKYKFKKIIADLQDSNEIEKIIEPFKDGLDILVNNAGIAQFFPLDALSKELFNENFYTNVYGPLYLTKTLIPALEKQQGSVVNISSIIVNNGKPNSAIYAATKGAVDGMTRSLALELAPKKIRVNGIAPGAINTPLLGKLGIPEEHIPALLKEQENAIPLQRLGEPEEIAQVVIALAESSYSTGAIWDVDGGISAA